MKISIGYEFIDGPWGGGNSFAIQLKNYLILWSIIGILKVVEMEKEFGV